MFGAHRLSRRTERGNTLEIVPKHPPWIHPTSGGFLVIVPTRYDEFFIGKTSFLWARKPILVKVLRSPLAQYGVTDTSQIVGCATDAEKRSAGIARIFKALKFASPDLFPTYSTQQETPDKAVVRREWKPQPRNIEIATQIFEGATYERVAKDHGISSARARQIFATFCRHTNRAALDEAQRQQEVSTMSWLRKNRHLFLAVLR